ncbi:MAG: hypothetical protein ACREIC_14575 [Limisphaerales bacterium]
MTADPAPAQLRAMSVGVQNVFCERFGCPEKEYEEQAFKRCLFWHARLLAPTLRFLHPAAFEYDLKFIRFLGAASDWQEAKTDVNNFHVLNDGKPSFWREALRLRVSGRKASRMAHQLFSSPERDKLT